MKIDFKGLLEGAFNSIFAKKEIEAVATERIMICRTCPFNSKNTDNKRPDEYCTDCGCNLYMKTRCMSCECPQKKWLKVLSEEEDSKLQEKLKDGKV